jgi:hypothetical protein
MTTVTDGQRLTPKRELHLTRLHTASYGHGLWVRSPSCSLGHGIKANDYAMGNALLRYARADHNLSRGLTTSINAQRGDTMTVHSIHDAIDHVIDSALWHMSGDPISTDDDIGEIF